MTLGSIPKDFVWIQLEFALVDFTNTVASRFRQPLHEPVHEDLLFRELRVLKLLKHFFASADWSAWILSTCSFFASRPYLYLLISTWTAAKLWRLLQCTSLRNAALDFDSEHLGISWFFITVIILDDVNIIIANLRGFRVTEQVFFLFLGHLSELNGFTEI